MSDGEVYEGPRLVVRDRPGDLVMRAFAERSGWILVADNADAHSAQYTREQSWMVHDDLFVHLVHDRAIDQSGLSVSSLDQATMEDYTATLLGSLDCYTPAELLGPVSPDPAARLTAVRRLGLAAPVDFDQAIFDRVSHLATDPDPAVRHAAICVSAYVAWPALRELLQHAGHADPDPLIRQDAVTLLRLYDNAGLPD